MRHVVQHATGCHGRLHHGALQLCRSAVGLVPADIVRGHNCSASIYSRIASACIPDQNPQNILGSQHLFSVYIHIPPGETGVKPTRIALQMFSAAASSSHFLYDHAMIWAWNGWRMHAVTHQRDLHHFLAALRLAGILPLVKTKHACRSPGGKSFPWA